MSGIYPNYYFIGALIAVLFLVYVCYLLLRIPQHSAASKHLGIAMIFTTLFNVAYVVSHGIYTVPNYITRLVNFYTPMVAGLHITIFFLSFPSVKSPRTIKSMLIVGHILILCAMAYLGLTMSTSPLYYLFNSHFWDSDSLPAQKYVSVLILLIFLLFLVVGITRGFKEKGQERLAVWMIVFGFIFATIPPAILQVLSRDNLIPRSTFMTTTVICNLVGFFVALVTFINVTRDRTSVLGRITGIALLTVLMIFQAVAYYWLHDAAEKSFDTVMYGRAREGYVIGRMPEGASAVYIYDYGKQKLYTPVPEEYSSSSAFAHEAQATQLMNELMQLKSQGNELTQAAQKVIAQIAIYSPLQAAYLHEFAASKKFTSGYDLAQSLSMLRNQQLYQIAKLTQMSGSDIEKKMNDMVAAIDKKFPGVAKFMATLTTISNGDKRNLLRAGLTPWRQQGNRLYRGQIFFEDTLPKHYIAYQFIDAGQKRVVEVGFPYLTYREAIAAAAWPLVAILIAAYFLILFGFNIFFRGALMKPVEAIVDGLKEINNDNFDARVKVHVEDEIGFMAKSFNKMARSIKAGRMRLQQYAAQLEQKVQDRTQELQTTLQDVQALKSQQDGDYFLTTLLLKPLGVNEVNSTFIGIESFVRQKKTFDFRHWSKDIGGDINISHIIELEGRRHIAFINGDAMGKSIQGAGGALVLGSVFHTIIERTQATYAMQQLSPERWLKNVFIELHRVFESFDGSMLVSGFFGLLDEHTGLMYHILAEHPRAVLYRDNKAIFIEKEKMLRKLGTSGVAGTLAIATTQLEPGDVLIVGSDGRDDIILGYDAHGGRIINEDEYLFLRTVEECDGNVEAMVAKIEALGEIMDDLSIMRIERYRTENAPSYAYDYSGVLDGVKRDLKSGKRDAAISRIEAYLKQDAFYPEAVKNLSQIYYQSKDYEKAARYAQDYLWLKPADAPFVYFASLCFRRIKDYRKSIDLSERLRLREIPLAKNLALLTDLHVRIGNVKRAESMLTELISMEPDFASIELLRKKIDKLKTETEPEPTVS